MTVSPGWYDDGVTPGVERWFDGHGWTETTRPAVPAAPVTGASVAGAAFGNAWLPQEVPVLPDPAPAASGLLDDPFAGGVNPTRATAPAPDVPRGGGAAAPGAPGFAIPTLEPEPARASSAAAAGYPTFGTPYRGSDGAAVAAAAAGAATGAAATPPSAAAAALASPYTNAAASPYPGTAVPTAGFPPPPPPPDATPYASAAAGFPAAGQPSRFGSDVDFAGGGAAGQPYGGGAVGQPYGAGVGGPGPGTVPALSGPSQELLERAFRSGGVEKANGDRQTALIVGGLGVGLLLVAGAVLRITLSMGTGAVWTWGFVAGAALLVKAGMSYVKAVRRGAPHLGPLGWTASAGALLLAGVVVVTSIQAAFSPMPVEVGSCFTDEGPEVQHVDCADPHDYTAVAVVDSLGECPSMTDVFARLDGEVVCLVDAGLRFGD